MRGAFLLLITLAVSATPLTTFAQVYDLQLQPTAPEAEEEFEVSLKGDVFNRSAIQWFINGSEKTEVKNSNIISLEAPKVGESMTVSAQVTLTDGSVVITKETLTPARVDLIIEANTVVPPFYKGRKLPSSGSTLTATALTFTKETKFPSEYTYIWKVDNKTQDGGATLGKNNLSFVPSFENEVIISVDVLTRGGKLVATKAQVIPIVSPEIHFYEKNPLRGLSFVALPNPFIFVGDEITVRAEGYFMGSELMGENVLREWKIDNSTTESSNDSDEEITLNKSDTSGSSVLSFHIRNLKQLLQGAKRSITIQF